MCDLYLNLFCSDVSGDHSVNEEKKNGILLRAHEQDTLDMAKERSYSFSGLAACREKPSWHTVHPQRVQKFALEKCAFQEKKQDVLSSESGSEKSLEAIRQLH